MSGKKVCINSQSAYYTGKEQSPLHFGLSAEGYEVNSIMEGFDKELWIVEVRNNKKVWTKKEHINKMTYEIPLINEFTDMKVTAISSAAAATVASITTDTSTLGTVTATTATSVPATTDDTISASFVIDNTLESNVSNVSNISLDNSKNKEKISKTIKPTDYTLFITYRIHQMKLTSTDNKKNYDCARYEWKEYKNKPVELQSIMVEAHNFSKK